VQEFHAAMAARDAQAMYGMVSPHIRSRLPLGDFRRDMGLDEAWASEPAQPVTAAVDRVCSCDDWTYADGASTTRCVMLLRGERAVPGGAPERARWLEMWEHTRGEWYYGSAAAGDRCPGEAGAGPTAPPASAQAPEVMVPDEARLRARIRAFYAAIVERDAGVLYETQTPSARQYMSREEYETGRMPYERGGVDETTIRITAEFEQVCSCRSFSHPYRKLRCNVLVVAVEEDATGQRRTRRQIDLWENAQGDWFYVATGTGQKCPGATQRGE